MKAFAFLILLLIAQFFAIALQHLIPPMAGYPFYGARILVFPAILAYATLTLPYGMMLFFVFCTGAFWDALTIQFYTSANGMTVAELPFGYSILIFGGTCLLLHELRPIFIRGQWSICLLASGAITIITLLCEYLLITFHRGGLVFPHTLWPRLLWPAFFSMFIALFVYSIFHTIADLLNYPVREENEEESLET